MKILIMGLPGSGKTTLAKALYKKLDCVWHNADEVRKQFDDWDFSYEGRKRQARRMRVLAEESKASGEKYVICDFVAPTKEMRDEFNADFTVWVNRITWGRFADTNAVFEPPEEFDVIIPPGKTVDEEVEIVLEKLHG